MERCLKESRKTNEKIRNNFCNTYNSQRTNIRGFKKKSVQKKKKKDNPIETGKRYYLTFHQ